MDYFGNNLLKNNIIFFQENIQKQIYYIGVGNITQLLIKLDMILLILY